MIFDKDTILSFLKEKTEKHEDWVIEARANNTVLNALVTGKGFDTLIERIEHVEGTKQSIARKKYVKDIRDLFNRVMKKRENVFQATGGSEKLLLENETIKSKFYDIEGNFKSNKSLFQYLSENYFQLCDIDPNGVIFLEYKDKEKTYPTYKSIQDIRYYESNGQLVDVIVFEAKEKENGNRIYRVVDSLTDWTIIENSGVYVIDESKTFQHPFGFVPAIILSEKNEVGSEVRLSPLNSVLELSKDYARDKSVLTIYKFLSGFPIHWRYVSTCRACNGVGKTGDGKVCGTCDGKGYLTKGDVTDMVTLPLPKEGQPNIAPNIAGFISPDLETWRQYKTDLKDLENKIEDTIWGTDRIEQSKSETATGRFIDVQPVINALNSYSQTVEYVHNTLANFILNFIDVVKKKEERYYYISYGRRYIIEGADTVLEKYQTAKEKGDNNTILDKLLEEFVLSKHKSDPYMQSVNLKKIKVEPYVHQTIEQINSIYGKDEAFKKIIFQKFWETANPDKTAEELSNEFLNYYQNEKSKISTVVE